MRSALVCSLPRQSHSKVTLFGQVTRPTLTSDAENVVKKIEGVENVDNQIEVLPLSRNDDRLRLRPIAPFFRRRRFNVIS
jgi:hyperosmotically inducible periplasmic protein